MSKKKVPNEQTEYTPLLVNRYSDSYFERRYNNDTKRQQQFQLDGEFLKRFKSHGTICDVGCSTGEFLESIDWKGERYGMEINEEVIEAAKQNRVNFKKNIFTEKDFFDAVVFRGTIQHVDEPFRMIKAAHQSLKNDGVLVFLATPNTDSLLYRLKTNLPALDPELNFFIPGVKNFSNALKNIGYDILRVETAYWSTPYRKFPSDILYFALNVISKKFYKHAFWGNMFSLAAKKHDTINS